MDVLRVERTFARVESAIAGHLDCSEISAESRIRRMLAVELAECMRDLNLRECADLIEDGKPFADLSTRANVIREFADRFEDLKNESELDDFVEEVVYFWTKE